MANKIKRGLSESTNVETSNKTKETETSRSPNIPSVSSPNSADNKLMQKFLHDAVTQALKKYIADLNGQKMYKLYDLISIVVEGAMLDVVMPHFRGNQTQAAEGMGINRGTLRKKLKRCKGSH